MRRLNAKEIESMLEPTFRNTVESFGIKGPLNSEDLERQDLLRILKGYDTRKVFRIIAGLIDTEEIKEITIEQLGGEIAADEIKAKIRALVENRLLMLIETSETKFQLSRASKLLITPLGICFLYCFRKGLLPGKNLDDSVQYAQGLLGSIHEDFLQDEVRESLLQTQVVLNKKEIVITLLLLFSQALTPDRALRISKSERQALLSDLTISLNKISGEIFDEPRLFNAARNTDNAIRRSTGGSGLEGKTANLYSKESSGDQDRLYFKCNDGEALSSVVSRVCESIKAEETRKNCAYAENVLSLIDKCIGNRSFLFSPWIRKKFLPRAAETMYLQKLIGMFRRNLT